MNRYRFQFKKSDPHILGFNNQYEVDVSGKIYEGSGKNPAEALTNAMKEAHQDYEYIHICDRVYSIMEEHKTVKHTILGAIQ